MRADRSSARPRVMSDLGRSVRTLVFVVAAVLLLSAPSCAPGPVSTGSSQPPTTVASTTQTSSAPPGQGAEAYLPDTSKWSFEVHDEDLVSWVDPIGHGIELIHKAIKDEDAPRKFADKSPKLGHFTLAMQLSASAIKCLNQHGHLELHSYVDRNFKYSVAVVLVIDAQAYRDVEVPLCVISDFFVGLVAVKSGPVKPALSPCVGATQKGNYVVAWMASTDVMCEALGGRVKPPENRRDLHRGDVGPDVANLQFNLNQVGYNLDVDGSFGPKTQSALKRFQECYPYNGAVQGVANKATKAALKKAQASVTTCRN